MTLARPRTVILTFWSANVMPTGASLRRMFAVGTVNSFVTRPLSVTVIFTVWLSARLVTPLGSSGRDLERLGPGDLCQIDRADGQLVRHGVQNGRIARDAQGGRLDRYLRILGRRAAAGNKCCIELNILILQDRDRYTNGIRRACHILAQRQLVAVLVQQDDGTIRVDECIGIRHIDAHDGAGDLVDLLRRAADGDGLCAEGQVGFIDHIARLRLAGVFELDGDLGVLLNVADRDGDA